MNMISFVRVRRETRDAILQQAFAGHRTTVQRMVRRSSTVPRSIHDAREEAVGSDSRSGSRSGDQGMGVGVGETVGVGPEGKITFYPGQDAPPSTPRVFVLGQDTPPTSCTTSPRPGDDDTRAAPTIAERSSGRSADIGGDRRVPKCSGGPRRDAYGRPAGVRTCRASLPPVGRGGEGEKVPGRMRMRKKKE